MPDRILIIDDSEKDALLIERALRKEWPMLAFKRVDSAAAMREASNEQSWACVLCDMMMPEVSVNGPDPGIHPA